MKVYTNGNDWVIAKSVKDAWQVWQEATLELREDYPLMKWIKEPDDKTLTICYEEPNENPNGIPEDAMVKTTADHVMEVTTTCNVWAKANGRGFLCSLDW